MSQDLPILPISELPPEIKAQYDKFLGHLDKDEFYPAQEAILQVVNHYEAADKEVPPELTLNYLRLTRLEEEIEKKTGKPAHA